MGRPRLGLSLNRSLCLWSPSAMAGLCLSLVTGRYRDPIFKNEAQCILYASHSEEIGERKMHDVVIDSGPIEAYLDGNKCAPSCPPRVLLLPAQSPQAKLQHSKLLSPTPRHSVQLCQGEIWRESIKMDSRADPGSSHLIPTQTP